MRRPIDRYFSLVMIFILLASLYPWVTAARALQLDHPPSLSSNRTLASFLRPDGTLDLPAGFSGSLDPAGYRLANEPGEAPRFVPADDGDEHWVDGFDYPGMNDTVSALAVDASSNL